MKLVPKQVIGRNGDRFFFTLLVYHTNSSRVIDNCFWYSECHCTHILLAVLVRQLHLVQKAKTQQQRQYSVPLGEVD